MVARLARAPIPWRELTGVLVVVALVAGFAWFKWARAPVAGPGTRTPAQIVKLSPAAVLKGSPLRTLVEVELADGRHEILVTPNALIGACKAGDKVVVTSTPVHVGSPEQAIDPATCS